MEASQVHLRVLLRVCLPQHQVQQRLPGGGHGLRRLRGLGLQRALPHRLRLGAGQPAPLFDLAGAAGEAALGAAVVVQSDGSIEGVSRYRMRSGMAC